MAVVHTVFNQCKRFARSLPAKNRNYVLAMANALDYAAQSSDTNELVLIAREGGSTLGTTSTGVLANYTGDKVTRTIYYYLQDSVGRIQEWVDGLTLAVTLTKSSTNGLYSLTDTYAATTTGNITFVRGIATLTAYIRNTRGYQELGLSGKAGGDSTGLSTTTSYKVKVAANGGSAVEYTITTASTVTFTAVLALLNAATSGVCTWSIVSGDVRCTSDSDLATSAISITDGDTSKLLTALSSTVDTAVARASISDNDTFTTAITNKTILGKTVSWSSSTLTVT